MKNAGVVLTGLLVSTGVVLGGWSVYPLLLPSQVVTVGYITVSPNGAGCAFTSTGYVPDSSPVLMLANGTWTVYDAPPTTLVYPSIGTDSTVYANEQGVGKYIWRFTPPGPWVKMTDLDPENYGFTKFRRVAGVNASSFWVLADGFADDAGAIYYETAKPVKVFYLGGASGSGYIAVPSVGGVDGTAYCVLQLPTNQWALWVLTRTGAATRYIIPTSGYYCDGLAAYSPGEVRLTMTPWGTSSGTRLYSFSNGVFTLLATYPDRVHLECYASASDGWGISYPATVYHLTGSTYDTYVLQDTVNGIGMVNVNDGWAVGRYNAGSGLQPRLWRWTSGAAVVPTSLGRVKAAFK